MFVQVELSQEMYQVALEKAIQDRIKVVAKEYVDSLYYKTDFGRVLHLHSVGSLDKIVTAEVDRVAKDKELHRFILERIKGKAARKVDAAMALLADMEGKDEPAG